jgi:glycosyltransferase involved in cell wall biosynthesis
MNIWFISKYASPPLYAKAPSRLFYLAKETKKLGNDVRLITSDANHFTSIPETGKLYNYEQQEGVDIIWIKTKKYKKTASFERILSWFDFEWKLFRMPLKKISKPDVLIISSLSIFTIIYGYYLKKKFKSFLVFEVRDIWPLTLIEEGGFSKWHPLSIIIGFVEKFGYRNSDLIVGTMPNLKQHVLNRGILNKPVFCSPLGFEPNNYVKEDLCLNNPFNKLIPKDKVIIGYAGSMGISNGLDIFIEAIKLMNSYNNIHFLLVGSGDLKEKFQNSLSENTNITFLPRIEQNQVKYFLNTCDILFLSTQDSKVWDFGQSMNKVVEYMLAAKPIIATYTGFPSMINEANCGIFLNTTKSEELVNCFVTYALMSNSEREAIGKNGLNWIFDNRKYNKLASDYLEIISDLKTKKMKQFNFSL